MRVGPAVRTTWPRPCEINLEDMPAAGRKSNQVLDSMDGVVWIHSYISEAEGKIYCVYEAPNVEAVYEHACAFPREHLHHTLARAAIAPGHECGLARELQIHALPPSA